MKLKGNKKEQVKTTQNYWPQIKQNFNPETDSTLINLDKIGGFGVQFPTATNTIYGIGPNNKPYASVSGSPEIINKILTEVRMYHSGRK